MEQTLVEQYRGDTLENVHKGHLCGVTGEGTVEYEIGDAEMLTYMRSTAKPVQAIPAIKQGINRTYHFSEQEIALMSSSHLAESFHVQALESMALKAGLAEDQLVFAPTYPSGERAKQALLWKQQEKRRIYHNCSGKHLGVLAYCKAMGYDLDSYWKPGHPAQVEIKSTLAQLAECPTESIVMATDGCGFPVFALPLHRLARVYLKLACPALIKDPATRTAVELITQAMHKHPEMVSGTDRLASMLLEDPNIIAKDGAQGIFCFALREEQLGFAVKVLDGSGAQWAYIVISLLKQIDYKNKQTIERLSKQFPLDIRNAVGQIVGEHRAIFSL